MTAVRKAPYNQGKSTMLNNPESFTEQPESAAPSTQVPSCPVPCEVPTPVTLATTTGLSGNLPGPEVPALPVADVSAADFFSQGKAQSREPLAAFRFSVEEEGRFLVLGNHYAVAYVHDARYTGIPGLDFNIQCGPGCPICLAGKKPKFVLAVLAVDIGTGVPGLLSVSGDVLPLAGKSNTERPQDRFGRKTGGASFFNQLWNLLVSDRRSALGVHVMRVQETRYVVTECSLPDEFMPTEIEIASLVEQFQAEKTRIIADVGVVLSPVQLRSNPAIQRMLKVCGRDGQ